MAYFKALRQKFRGINSPIDVLREALRRAEGARRIAAERRNFHTVARAGARLKSAFGNTDLRVRLSRADRPSFWPSVRESSELEIDSRIIETADSIVNEREWPLLGFGTLNFDTQTCWRRDPISGFEWPLEFYADIDLTPKKGVDIRILWELNRLGHVIPLALAYAGTHDEKYAETFFSHVEAWSMQNPYGRGPNWTCAMEAAIRAVNLLAAFDTCRFSNAFTPKRAELVLQTIDQHGHFIYENNEFSYISTSNHYLSNVAGLFWIGTLMPELERSEKWRRFGIAEMLREIDKQTNDDGTNYENSSGYHRFITEMLLHSFLLAKRNEMEVVDRLRQKLTEMAEYLAALTRPDGRIPLIGDADGSRVVPIMQRDADEADYLLSIAASALENPALAEWVSESAENLCLFGKADGKINVDLSDRSRLQKSRLFPQGGVAILQGDDCRLLFTACDCGLAGRGSHAHNDILSVEIFSNGQPLIVDPGSYAYNLDIMARHKFRSTAFHSTVEVDGEEQNTIVAETPFVISNESRPRITEWNTDEERDRVAAVHFGYARLREPVTHARTVEYWKARRYWRITDEFTGGGAHDLIFSFHLAPNLRLECVSQNIAAVNGHDGLLLLICPTHIASPPYTELAWFSRNYGQREASQIVRWKLGTAVPFTAGFVIVPVARDDDPDERLRYAIRMTENIDN